MCDHSIAQRKRILEYEVEIPYRLEIIRNFDISPMIKVSIYIFYTFVTSRRAAFNDEMNISFLRKRRL